MYINMKYYIPTSTLNISNILSSGSISPYSFYVKRQFGIKSFEPIKECERFKDQIVLFRKYPLFSIVSDKESYPVCIKIEIPDNMVIPSNIPDVFYTTKTIYISPSNITFIFENEEYLKKSLFWIDISDEAKFFDQYKDKFILRDSLSETFTLTSNILDNLIIEQTIDIETEVIKDWKIDKIRGAMCGLFIGTNGFDCFDGIGTGYKRNKIKELFSQLLQIFDGRAKLVTQTSQLEKSALSEFAKKEQRIHKYSGSINNIIIVTLTRLFVMRIVASVRSLSSLSILIFLSVSVFCCSTSLMSLGDRLKNAISEPLANPDNTRRTAARMKAIIAPADIGSVVTKEEISTKGIIIKMGVFPDYPMKVAVVQEKTQIRRPLYPAACALG